VERCAYKKTRLKRRADAKKIPGYRPARLCHDRVNARNDNLWGNRGTLSLFFIPPKNLCKFSQQTFNRREDTIAGAVDHQVDLRVGKEVHLRLPPANCSNRPDVLKKSAAMQ
jgi:hypothetical protein